MGIIKLIAYLFYQTNKGSKYGADIPIGNTACALTLLTILTAFPFLVYFDFLDHFYSFKEKNRISDFSRTMIIISPLILFFAILVKSFHLDKANYDAQKVNRAWVYLGVYTLFMFFLIALATLYKKGMLFN